MSSVPASVEQPPDRLMEFKRSVKLAMATSAAFHQERLLQIERTLAIQALHDSMGARAEMSVRQFTQTLAGWEVIPVVDQTEITGAVIRNGPEIHIGMKRTPRAAARRLLRATLHDTIAHHGAAVTKVMRTNPAGLKFCERLGFQVLGSDRDTWYLGCNNARHIRKGTP